MVSLQSLSMGFWLGFLFWFSPKLGIFLQVVFPALQTNSPLTPGPEALPSMCCCRLSKRLSHFRCFPDKTNCKRYQVSFNFTFTENISMLLEMSHPQNPEWDTGGRQWSRSRGTGSEAPGERSTINTQCFPSTAYQGEVGEKKKTTPHYGVSNKLRNFFDFHDVHMAVNFRVML